MNKETIIDVEITKGQLHKLNKEMIMKILINTKEELESNIASDKYMYKSHINLALLSGIVSFALAFLYTFGINKPMSYFDMISFSLLINSCLKSLYSAMDRRFYKKMNEKKLEQINKQISEIESMKIE